MVLSGSVRRAARQIQKASLFYVDALLVLARAPVALMLALLVRLDDVVRFAELCGLLDPLLRHIVDLSASNTHLFGFEQ